MGKTMKKSTAIFIATALFVVVASANSTSAVEKIITGPTSSSGNKIAPSTGNKVEHLTYQECEGLGGKVEDAEPNSGCIGTCHVVDQAGVSHLACVDQVRH